MVHRLLNSISEFVSKLCWQVLLFILQVSATSFYILVSLASYTIFGEDIEEDILKNINPSAMQQLLGPIQVSLKKLKGCRRSLTVLKVMIYLLVISRICSDPFP